MTCANFCKLSKDGHNKMHLSDNNANLISIIFFSSPTYA